jgi:hypothetical protein
MKKLLLFVVLVATGCGKPNRCNPVGHWDISLTDLNTTYCVDPGAVQIDEFDLINKPNDFLYQDDRDTFSISNVTGNISGDYCTLSLNESGYLVDRDTGLIDKFQLNRTYHILDNRMVVGTATTEVTLTTNTSSYYCVNNWMADGFIR